MIWPCSATSPHHLPGAGALGPIRAWTHRPRRRSLIWTPCTPHPRSPPQSSAWSTSTAARSCRASCPSCMPGLTACRLCSSQRLPQGPVTPPAALHLVMQHCLHTRVDRMSLVGLSIVIDSQSNILSAASSRRAPIKAPNHIVRLCN